jgi:hypothetical protein
MREKAAMDSKKANDAPRSDWLTLNKRRAAGFLFNRPG